MKLSARNILKGKVVTIKPGAINTEVILELPGGRRSSRHHQRVCGESGIGCR